MNNHLYPDIHKTAASIQNVIDKYVQVYFHAGNKNPNQPETNTFDIGAETLKVTGEKKIIGVLDFPEEPKKKPTIKGTAGGLTTPGNMDCGIFSICTPDPVEITNLDLEHTPGPPSPNMHGSSTIAYYVDNTKKSTLTVTDCELDTAATAGISIDAFNSQTSQPSKHNVIIRGCTIKGRSQPVPGAGNYICVRLGGMLPVHKPIDMRDSIFEVSGCTLDTAEFAAVMGANFHSDSTSAFFVSRNVIGYHPSVPGVMTRVGIMFIDPYHDFAEQSRVKGNLTIIDNKIRLLGYFMLLDPVPEVVSAYADWSVGIGVQVNNTDAAQRVTTVIAGNEIDFRQTLAPKWPNLPPLNLRVFDGISYGDVAVGGALNTTAVIQNNRLLSNPSLPPLRGLWLRRNAHDVTITNNDLTGFTASHAQLLVDPDVKNCDFSGNLYGPLADLAGDNYVETPVAVVVCDGSTNRLFEEDFVGSAVPGWKLPLHTEGPGCVKLEAASNLNLEILEPWNPPDPTRTQWWDEGTNNTVITLP